MSGLGRDATRSANVRDAEQSLVEHGADGCGPQAVLYGLVMLILGIPI